MRSNSLLGLGIFLLTLCFAGGATSSAGGVSPLLLKAQEFYESEDWPRFFGTVKIYNLQKMHGLAPRTDENRATFSALESIALAKHCLWDEAFSVLDTLDSTDLRNEVLSAVQWMEEHPKRYSAKNIEVVLRPVFNRVNFWKTEDTAFLSTVDPDQFHHFVQSKCGKVPAPLSLQRIRSLFLNGKYFVAAAELRKLFPIVTTENGDALHYWSLLPLLIDVPERKQVVNRILDRIEESNKAGSESFSQDANILCLLWIENGHNFPPELAVRIERVLKRSQEIFLASDLSQIDDLKNLRNKLDRTKWAPTKDFLPKFDLLISLIQSKNLKIRTYQWGHPALLVKALQVHKMNIESLIRGLRQVSADQSKRVSSGQVQLIIQEAEKWKRGIQLDLTQALAHLKRILPIQPADEPSIDQLNRKLLGKIRRD